MKILLKFDSGEIKILKFRAMVQVMADRQPIRSSFIPAISQFCSALVTTCGHVCFSETCCDLKPYESS